MAEEKAEEQKNVKEAVSGFFGEVNSEFHRITWPRGHQLVESTVVVLTLIVLLSALVLVFDKFIEFALKLIHA